MPCPSCHGTSHRHASDIRHGCLHNAARDCRLLTWQIGHVDLEHAHLGRGLCTQRMLYLIVTSLSGILVTQIFARPLPTCASQVLQVPSLQSYLMGILQLRATSRSF